MTAKFALLAAALVPMLASAQLPLDAPTIGDNHPMVHMVRCATATGTAFRTGKYTYLSVSHVTRNPNCTIDGQTPKLLWEDPERDFAILHLEPKTDRGLKIDCGGFVKGRHYVAIGHARSMSEQTRITLVATGENEGGFAVLRGLFTVIPGMSGGPIWDKETGKVVGTTNVYNPHRAISGSVALRDTAVCAAD